MSLKCTKFKLVTDFFCHFYEVNLILILTQKNYLYFMTQTFSVCPEEDQKISNSL